METVAIEGTWRCCLATWQSLLVPEPGNPCLEVPSMHEAGPPFLQTQQVAGAVGWLGCGHQAGQWSTTGTETADSSGWPQPHHRPQTLTPVISGVPGRPYTYRYAYTHFRRHARTQTRTYEQRCIPSPALYARRQNRIRHTLRHLQGQARRSLQTSGREQDPEEDQEISGQAEERGGGRRNRARSLGLKGGKDLDEEELLEKEAGWGGAGEGGATGGGVGLTGLKLWAQGTHREWACPASWQRPDCALLSPCQRRPVRETVRVKVTMPRVLSNCI